MAQTELKTIPVDKILANFSQPREMFDRSKIKELSESILSNGLINPITVREYKNGKYMIVSGERRWQAHKIAGLKTIQAFVKEYKNDGQMMVESLIENVHREDLTPLEKAKFLKRIMEIEKLSMGQLGERVGIASSTIEKHLSLLSIEKEIKSAGMPTKDYTTLSDISKVGDKKARENLLRKMGDEGVASIRKEARFLRDEETPKEVRKSLISNEISIGQAESLSRIHSEKAREKALEQVKQHRHTAERYEHIANITPKLMERAKPELTDAVKRQFDTIQRRIFEYLNDAKTSLSKVNNNIKEANMMLNQLMSKSFEYGLDKRTLITTMQQMKSISDRIKEFEIQNEKFDELKNTFLERVEDRLNELK